MEINKIVKTKGHNENINDKKIPKFNILLSVLF